MFFNVKCLLFPASSKKLIVIYSYKIFNKRFTYIWDIDKTCLIGFVKNRCSIFIINIIG